MTDLTTTYLFILAIAPDVVAGAMLLTGKWKISTPAKPRQEAPAPKEEPAQAAVTPFPSVPASASPAGLGSARPA